jgi:uncharacterized protein
MMLASLRMKNQSFSHAEEQMAQPTAIPTRSPARRWYREPWPWIIMIAPAVAVLSGALMLWLAITSYDGLVSDDYYKEGLAINQMLRRDQRASELGYQAHASLSDDGTLIRVRVVGAAGAALPETLQLRFAHPTRAGHDQIALLYARSTELYEANMAPLREGRWRVSIEDAAGSWRLGGTWRLPQQRSAELRASSAK